jgi:hypothetical protein
METGYLPDGPDVWRVSCYYDIEQFDTLEKALNYMENKLNKNSGKILVLQKVNLRKVNLSTPKLEPEVDKLGR